jgi:molybdopterin synthase catalytic subunit
MTSLPPKITVRVQEHDFDLSQEIAALRNADARIGAIVNFLGTVRDLNDGSNILSLTLEHAPGMTESALQNICEQAHRRFEIFSSLVIHRFGQLQPCDQIVLVAVTSAHRAQAFMACEFLMDYLKTQAPFWKKEQTPEGARWVDAREADTQAEQRWKINTTVVNDTK